NLHGCAVALVMGAPSPRRRAPDEAAIAVFVGVERGGSADDRGGGKRPEIAAVEAVADLPVHEEQLGWRDGAAALPDRQGSAQAIAFERLADSDPIDCDAGARSADALSGKRGDTLHQRHATRQIAANR